MGITIHKPVNTIHVHVCLYVCLYMCCPDPEVWKAVKTQCVSSSSAICDIHGGRKYRELQQFVSQGNLTLTVNTDGVALFKSSSVSMWPIWILINELPISMR